MNSDQLGATRIVKFCPRCYKARVATALCEDCYFRYVTDRSFVGAIAWWRARRQVELKHLIKTWAPRIVWE